MVEEISAKHKEVDNLSIDGDLATFTCKTHQEKCGVKVSDAMNAEAACPKCNDILSTDSHEDLIQQISKVLGAKFDYSLFQDVGIYKDSVIICPNHGLQKLSLKKHLTEYGGHGCGLCSLEETDKKNRRINKSDNDWMDRAIKVFQKK